MPPVEDHVKISMKRTGKPYKELHNWMDEEYVHPSGSRRHEITNIPQTIKVVNEKFGEDAVLEFLQHIKDDYENNILLKFCKKLRKFLLKK